MFVPYQQCNFNLPTANIRIKIETALHAVLSVKSKKEAKKAWGAVAAAHACSRVSIY
jgi:hypothetical protein